MRQPSVPAIKADNPRLRMVRIDIGGDARNYTIGQQRVTVVPLTIRRKQNRKVMIPPHGDDSILGAGGHDLPMIRMLGKAFYWQRLLDEGRAVVDREHHYREAGGELLEELQPRLVGHRDITDADPGPAAGQPG